VVIRTAVAQPGVGATQTDWVRVPAGTQFVEVILNTTAMTGTTPIIHPQLFAADPIIADDAHAFALASPNTNQTSPGVGRVLVGPSVSGIANNVAWGVSAGVDNRINTIVPKLLGLRVLSNFTGNETYSYTLTVRFTT
jgi:hypothetical protein